MYCSTGNRRRQQTRRTGVLQLLAGCCELVTRAEAAPRPSFSCWMTLLWGRLCPLWLGPSWVEQLVAQMLPLEPLPPQVERWSGMRAPYQATLLRCCSELPLLEQVGRMMRRSYLRPAV